MALTQITTHEADAKARLPEQFKNKEVINAVVGAIGLEMQDLEDAIFPMFDLLDIATMIGAQLDGIGDILTEPRAGLSDVDYRVALLEKAARVTASGTPEQVIERFITLASPPGAVDYVEAFPAGYCIGATTPTLSDVQSGAPHSVPPNLPDIADPNLRGAWLNESVSGTADDFSAEADDMTAVGSPTFPDIGVTLNGSSQYLRRLEATWRNGDSLGAITAWVRRDSLGASGIIFASSDETSTANFLYLSVNADDVLELVAKAGASDHVIGTAIIPAGEWVHVALVSDGSEYFAYVNGVLDPLSVVTGANNGDWLAETPFRDNVTIGVLRFTSTASHFDGSIEDVRYYSDVRTAAEVLADFNAGLRDTIDLTTGGLGTDDAFVGGFAVNVTRGEVRGIDSHTDDTATLSGLFDSWLDADVLFFYRNPVVGDILDAMVGASPTGVFVGLIDLFALPDDDLFLLPDDEFLYVPYASSGG